MGSPVLWYHWLMLLFLCSVYLLWLKILWHCFYASGVFWYWVWLWSVSKYVFFLFIVFYFWHEIQGWHIGEYVDCSLWLMALFGLGGGYLQKYMVSQPKRPQFTFISNILNFHISLYLKYTAFFSEQLFYLNILLLLFSCVTSS